MPDQVGVPDPHPKRQPTVTPSLNKDMYLFDYSRPRPPATADIRHGNL